MKNKDRQGPDLTKSQDEMELSRLMQLAQGGDSKSYVALLSRIAKMLKPFIEGSFMRLGLGSSGAKDDVLQDILLALHAKRASFDPNEFFLPWMYAIARYKIIDHFRKERVTWRTRVPIEDELETLEAIVTMESSTRTDLNHLMNSLPEKQREVLRLVKLEELSIAEAAKRTGYSESDIKVSVHRAINTLKRLAKDSDHAKQ